MHIVVSYVPLLRGEAGQTLPPEEAMEQYGERVEACPDGSCEAAIWTIGDTGPSITFVIERADEIREHLLEWAEHEPEQWFDLQVTEAPTHYAAALVPRIKKTVDRYQAALALRLGMAVPVLDDVSVIFRAISFQSAGPSSVFASISPLLRSVCPVGIVDQKIVDPQNPEACLDRARVLGFFNVVRDGSFVKVLGSQRQRQESL